MKTSIILSTVITPLFLAPVVQADLSMGYVAPNNSATQGNCDLLATNTVRATFKGVQDRAVAAMDGSIVNTQVAVFEVIENLAHRRLSMYGDGPMPAGMQFAVELSRSVPGQPAEIVDTISKLQPGDETVMRMDHLFLYGDPDGQFIRPCARMARKEIPQPTDAEPDTTAPVQAPGVRTINISGPGISGQATISGSGISSAQFAGHSYQKSVSVDKNGNRITQEIETTQELDPATGKLKTRMFINGMEVDPQTQQPLMPPTAPEQPAQQEQQQPAAQPATPQPATPAPAPAPTPDDPNDDTILENESF